jgi:hypothetical protein
VWNLKDWRLWCPGEYFPEVRNYQQCEKQERIPLILTSVCSSSLESEIHWWSVRDISATWKRHLIAMGRRESMKTLLTQFSWKKCVSAWKRKNTHH